MATVTTAAVQTLPFSATPAASTTTRSAQFSWTISANDAGEAPLCVLDPSETSGTEIPCAATGATIDGLSVGAHTLVVYPVRRRRDLLLHAGPWSTLPPTPPPAPVNPPDAHDAEEPIDLDGDGIDNSWLIGGKPAPAPRHAEGARHRRQRQAQALAAARKGAKKIRVYRADGKGGYKLVKTLTPKSKTFTDKKVKPGHTYKYKTVAVNAKGQQGASLQGRDAQGQEEEVGTCAADSSLN